MPSKTLCPVCGVGVPIDEDGCCGKCGATATGKGADEVLAELAQVRQRAEAAEARVAEAEWLLRGLEFVHYADNWRYCPHPSCESREDAEHEPGCPPANFLSAAPPAAPLLAPLAGFPRPLSMGQLAAMAGVLSAAEEVADTVRPGVGPRRALLGRLAEAVAALRSSRKEGQGG